jgi:pilus assembly protein TadC
MLAILFTNVAFASYLIYLIAERKKNCYKSSQFWLALVGLLAALFVAFYHLYLPGGVTTGMDSGYGL